MAIIEYSPSDQDDDGNAEHYATGAHLNTPQDAAERAAHAKLIADIRAARETGDDARIAELLAEVGYR